jgi:hypothetical protein
MARPNAAPANTRLQPLETLKYFPSTELVDRLSYSSGR